VRLPNERAAQLVAPKRAAPAAARSPAQLAAAGQFASMLLPDLRDECLRLGLSSIGDRHELEARLKQAAEAATPTQSNIRGKYADVLRERGAAGLLHGRDGSEGGLRPQGGSLPMSEFGKVEKERERAVRAHADRELSSQGDRQGYAFQPGAKDLLHYLDMRGMARVLLPSEGSEAHTGAQAAALASALQVPPFAASLETAGAEGVRRGEHSSLLLLADALGLPACSLMVVSDDTAAIAAARRASMLACYVAKRIDGRPRRYPASYSVAELEDVRGCIEEVNGVTFRDNNTEILSKYVGGD